MDWRRMMRGTGRVLISAGVLILLFVVYQLWGTGIAEARSQRALKGDFAAVPVRPTSPGTTTPPVTAPPPVPDGEAIAVIRIPKIGVEKAVVEGVALGDLKKGPGHYRDTPLPGQPGNSAIAGHRTTYGAPFYRLDELAPGDRITVATRQGTFDYEVRETKVVRPSEVSVLDPTPDNRLTLTTCHPRFSARQRLIVVAALLGPAAPAPVGTSTTAPPGTIPGDPQSLDAGLSGDEASNGPAVLWGGLAALLWLATWALSKRWRKWPAYLVGTPVFLVVLFVFFENFSRLLPANY